MRNLIAALVLAVCSQAAQAQAYDGPYGLSFEQIKANIKNKCLADFKGIDISAGIPDRYYGYTNSSDQCERRADELATSASIHWTTCNDSPGTMKECKEAALGVYQEYMNQKFVSPRPKAVVKTIANSRSAWRGWYLMCLHKHEYFARYKPFCRNAASVISEIRMTPAQAGVEPDLR